MKHRKNAHIENVSTCRHALNGRCNFSSRNCWYIHKDEINEKNINEKDKQAELGVPHSEIQVELE